MFWTTKRRSENEKSCADVGVGVVFVDFDVKILTALKGWVGHAPKGRGALHINCILGQRGPGALHIIIIYRDCALHIII